MKLVTYRITTTIKNKKFFFVCCSRFSVLSITYRFKSTLKREQHTKMIKQFELRVTPALEGRREKGRFVETGQEEG